MDFETTVAIKAPAATVWAALIDVEHWPDLTPSITGVERLNREPFARGARTRVKQPGTPPLVWEVTDFTPGTAFTWRAASPGVTTVGTHMLRPGVDGAVTLTLGIHQSGLTAPIVGWLTGARTRRYVQMEAEGLKRRCEAA